MKTRRVMVLAAVVLTIVAALSTGCSPIKQQLVGEWLYSEPLVKSAYILKKDGTMENIVTMVVAGSGNSSKKYEGECKTEGDKLIISGIYNDVESKEYTYSLSEDEKTLTLTRDGDDMVLTKVE